MAEQPARKRGRPATRTEDWELTHKWIRLLNVTFERWRALKNELKLPNGDSIASFLLSLYSELNSGNNNSGQREELVRGEYDLSASHPLTLYDPNYFLKYVKHAKYAIRNVYAF